MGNINTVSNFHNNINKMSYPDIMAPVEESMQVLVAVEVVVEAAVEVAVQVVEQLFRWVVLHAHGPSLSSSHALECLKERIQ